MFLCGTGSCLEVWFAGSFGLGLVIAGGVGWLVGIGRDGDHPKGDGHDVVGIVGGMKGKLKVFVSVDGGRRIFVGIVVDMEVVVAGVVVEGGRRINGMWG